MDTNLIEVIKSLQQIQNKSQMILNNPVFISSVVTLFLALATYIQSRTNAVRSIENKKKVEETVEILKEVHKEVNSGATKLVNKFDGANQKVLELSGEVEMLKENLRGRDIAEAKARVVAKPIV